MPFTFWPQPTALLWICMGIFIMLLFGVMLHGIVWFVMDMYHENCYSCEKEMPILQRRLTEYERQLNITNKEHERKLNIINAEHRRQLNKAEMEHKKQIGVFHERETIISNQAHLIKRFRYEMYEAEKSMDQYIANLEKYHELEATSISWFSSLSREDEEYMYRLRDYLELERVSEVNLKAATVIVRQGTEQTLKILSSVLEHLEVALNEIDIDEMKRLQTVLNEMEHSAVLNSQMKYVKSRIINELQARGVFYWISSAFYNLIMATLSKMDMELVAKILRIILQ